MTKRRKKSVRGACPGALRPMESGDGLIVRVRPRAGALAPHALGALAEAAAGYGNGYIDLTRRANLQIRGVRPDTLGDLQAVLAALGLLDAEPEAEAVRNILVSPLAGADPAEIVDPRLVARELERHLSEDRALWRLPAKFGFICDGGGGLTLDEERADVRLKAIRAGRKTAFAIGIGLGEEGAEETRWLGCVAPDKSAAAAVATAKAFIETQAPGSRLRLADAGPDVAAHIERATAALLAPLDRAPASRVAERPLGVVARDGAVLAAGFAAPFGRIEAASLTEIARRVAAAGMSEVRLSPWRTMYVPVSEPAEAEAISAAACRAGFIVDGRDPMLKIDACPGSTGCRSAYLDTRAAACRVAALVGAMNDIASVHISGCSKGCARSSPAALVLSGERDRYAILFDSVADGTASAYLGSAELHRLPEVVARRTGMPNHV